MEFVPSFVLSVSRELMNEPCDSILLLYVGASFKISRFEEHPMELAIDRIGPSSSLTSSGGFHLPARSILRSVGGTNASTLGLRCS